MTARALIVDWGGVLTVPMKHAMGAWADGQDIDVSSFVAVMRAWLGPEAGLEARLNPVHALERGEMQTPHFEAKLAAALSRQVGREIPAEGLLESMFAYFTHAPDMTALVRRARASGILTGLLSNSWGNDYPDDLFDGMFDTVVISGEVGMRKPEPRIFELTVERLGVAFTQCVFVDDLLPNVRAARALGMVGVLHEDYEDTAMQLEVLFDRPLAG